MTSRWRWARRRRAGATARGSGEIPGQDPLFYYT